MVLVLDQITDPHNVGAILRSAAAFAVKAIVTTARHSPEATGVLAKSASGALELVPLVTVQNLARALTRLNERGFLTVGLDSEGAEDLSRIALVHFPKVVLKYVTNHPNLTQIGDGEQIWGVVQTLDALKTRHILLHDRP